MVTISMLMANMKMIMKLLEFLTSSMLMDLCLDLIWSGSWILNFPLISVGIGADLYLQPVKITVPGVSYTTFVKIPPQS